jgi:hypothetical protein
VESAEDKMSSERGVDGDFCSLMVTNLSKHDYVRIGAQEGAEGRSKGEADLWLHLLGNPRVISDLLPSKFSDLVLM